ncbi:TPA: hypothetical protein PP434_002569 [Staphylococcus aureus]|nr:hypothetical protein [Staphylococcus aureus]HDJ2986084.1 hypothetical protein [Staphylococcus aureus]HDJ3209846.1 hypothetical protein [Staphylococcus aureus]
MRRFFSLLLVSTLTLTACGEKEKPKKEENKKSQTQNNQFNNNSVPSDNAPANINDNDSQNTNLNDEHVVSPGWTKDEQAKAFEEYKKGKEDEARAGASAVPGANIH